jgi:ferredoxin-type protein NapF
MKSISRAQFLRGDWRGDKPEIRPPWAGANEVFSAACNGGGDCVKACPRNILKLSPRGLPLVDFSNSECTFCGDCVDACPTGALHRDNKHHERPWQLTALISDQCLSINGTQCERCIESCPIDAIVARPALHGRMHMSIRDSVCNGCGACVNGCPVKAVSIQDFSRRKQ